MADRHGKPKSEPFPAPDPKALAKNMLQAAKRCGKLLAEIVENRDIVKKNMTVQPSSVGDAFIELTSRLLSDPVHLAKAQVKLWGDYLQVMRSTSQRLLGEAAAPVIIPAASDRRFRHADWQDNDLFDFIKQSYLVTARWLQDTVAEVEDVEPRTKKKIEFYTRQFVDALSPSNFLLTNPEVLRATLSSSGQNLVNGLDHILEDLHRGNGRLAIKMTDSDAFEVGRNIATTPGKVVFRNELMELIQYTPTTPTVYETPLLIVPPWINKFYILDLRPENSFIRFAVDQGYTVFVISWVNPDSRLAQKSFEAYMTDGVLVALGQIEKAAGQARINVIGYCIGGTLMAATLAYMAATGDTRIGSATFFTAQVDFSEAGELTVFIDDSQLGYLTDRMSEKGYLEGGDMATTFNMLRANDLIWSFVVNNYLLGRDPFPFDLLFWNSDATRMPYAMHIFYLREFYQKNRLVVPGEIKFKGVPIDLGKVAVPLYLVSTREDHIAPAKSVFKSLKVFSGPMRFVLAGSGHIAGVINPPAGGKYQYWTNDDADAPTLDDWIEGATEHKGSWWPDWDRWMAERSGGRVPARVPGAGKLKAIEDAPGSYVRVKSEG